MRILDHTIIEMAEDQNVITNENFDSFEANDDKCTQTLDVAKTTHPRPTSFDQNLMFIEALEHLKRLVVYFKGQAIGTIAVLDNASGALNRVQKICRVWYDSTELYPP